MNAPARADFSRLAGKQERNADMPITPPQYAKEVLLRLERAGYRAYFVGGCVRDMLLGRRPQDWDICTDARPEDVMRVFARSEPTGLQHGTVTVLMRARRLEVTTFRAEGKYIDHRRPENVRFVRDLKEDLMRRDFSVNAMALSRSGELTDLYGGRRDLEAGLIRCVGDPAERFEEDALRMLRALRFSAKLGFVIEEKTLNAIHTCAPLAASLAPERVSDELGKTLCTPRPETVSRAVECGLLDAFLQKPGTETDMHRLKYLPKSPQARWAGLCACLLRDGLIDSAGNFLRGLRLSGAIIRHCAAGAETALSAPPEGRLAWKKLLAREGGETAYCTACAMLALSPTNALRVLREIKSSGECCSIRELAVSGKDLLDRGYSGTAVGRTLSMLLDHVLEHPEDNRRETLLPLL